MNILILEKNSNIENIGYGGSNFSWSAALYLDFLND